MATLVANHFLALPRPDVLEGPPEGVVDTTTVAAHDFDVDARTGFMPPQPPIDRLPVCWESWEVLLEDAILRKLRLGDTPDLADEAKQESEEWRDRVRKTPILPTAELKKSEILLRRAHHVLAWTMHFYINTLPPTAPIIIPRPISVPLLEVSSYMALPPLLTYSDDVLYNTTYPPTSPVLSPSDFDVTQLKPSTLPALDSLRCQTLFTSTRDEAEFYLASARIELRGVGALELMRATMDEAFVGDDLALRRIAMCLARLAGVLRELTRILLAVREGCDPEVFYHAIRPWFKGEDSMVGGRKWVFEGVGEAAYPHLKQPTELSGPSAGQSALIHAIDIFLGVDHFSHSPTGTSTSSVASAEGDSGAKSSGAFLTQMHAYMPRHHRAFLRHLRANPRPLRALIEAETGPIAEAGGVQRNADLLAGYNTAVSALREFRDAHLRIVALYIVGPARRVEAGKRMTAAAKSGPSPAADDSAGAGYGEKGTGGTNAMLFLKGVRDRTAEAVLDGNE